MKCLKNSNQWDYFNIFVFTISDINTIPGYAYESPYIPQNNSLIPSNDGYIYFNVEKPVRGRFEHSFFETGLAILAASGVGAFRGFVQGKEAALSYPPKLRRIV